MVDGVVDGGVDGVVDGVVDAGMWHTQEPYTGAKHTLQPIIHTNTHSPPPRPHSPRPLATPTLHPHSPPALTTYCPVFLVYNSSQSNYIFNPPTLSFPDAKAVYPKDP